MMFGRTLLSLPPVKAIADHAATVWRWVGHSVGGSELVAPRIPERDELLLKACRESESAHEVVSAIRALTEIPSVSAISAIAYRAKYGGHDTSIRIEAIEALAELALSPVLRPVVQRALRQNHFDAPSELEKWAQHASAGALIRLNDALEIDGRGLRRALSGIALRSRKNEELRSVAIAALVARDPLAAVRHFEALAKGEGSPSSKQAAIETLGYFVQPEVEMSARQVLLAIAQDLPSFQSYYPTPGMQERRAAAFAAVRALVAVPDRERLSAVVGLLSHPDNGLSSQVERSLGEVGRRNQRGLDPVVALMKWLEQSERLPSERERGLRVISVLGGELVVPYLLKELHSLAAAGPAEIGRLRCCEEGLRRAASTFSLHQAKELASMLGAPSLLARECATAVYRDISQRYPLAVDACEKNFKDPHASDRLIMLAGQILCELPSNIAGPQSLERVLRSKHSPERSRVVARRLIEQKRRAEQSEESSSDW